MKTSRGPGRVSLPRALSKLGIASRSEAMRLIADGAVSVNKKVESNPHRWVDLNHDRIELKNQLLKRRAFRYLLLNKPLGLVTTRSDERGQKTVFDLLGDKGEGMSPVGRLDKETAGLLLFTNDHQLSNLLTSPESNFQKTYVAKLDRPISKEDSLRISRGMDIEIKGTSYRTKPALISQPVPGTLEISITEGKNKQIRRMLDSLGYEIVSLRRIAEGSLKLGSLQEGETRELSTDEVQELKQATHSTLPAPRKHRSGPGEISFSLPEQRKHNSERGQYGSSRPDSRKHRRRPEEASSSGPGQRKRHSEREQFGSSRPDSRKQRRGPEEISPSGPGQRRRRTGTGQIKSSRLEPRRHRGGPRQMKRS